MRKEPRAVERSGNVVSVEFGKKGEKKAETPIREASPLDLEKLSVFEKLIGMDTVMVVLDATNGEARVPPAFKACVDLRLNFSYGFNIPDFAFDAQGVRATLSFDEGYFFCDIAWNTVFAMNISDASERALWPDSVPGELRQLKPKIEGQSHLKIVD